MDFEEAWHCIASEVRFVLKAAYLILLSRPFDLAIITASMYSDPLPQRFGTLYHASLFLTRWHQHNAAFGNTAISQQSLLSS